MVQNRMKKRWRLFVTEMVLMSLLFLIVGNHAMVAAQETEAATAEAIWTTDIAVDTLWVLTAGILVFFMNAGFGCVEAGFCRAKNAVNILGKNFVVFGIASIAFWIIGWALMFGDGNSFLGLNGFLLHGADNSPATGDGYAGVFGSISWTGIPLLAKFFFQLVFAGTAATIVSGCVAERIHYKSFMVFSFVLVAISYPITGHWIWGGGWLQNLGKLVQPTTPEEVETVEDDIRRLIATSTKPAS